MKKIAAFFFICGWLAILITKVGAMEIFTVDNRLPVIFEHRKSVGVAAAQVWVKVGSKNEEPRIAGITHFIEHLIFKGSADVKAGQMAARIESLGGTVNAFTSYDNTVYHIVVPTQTFEEGLGLLLDAVKNASFPEEEIAKEKQVVLEEIKMGEDDPHRKLFKELFQMSYEGHPYGRPIIGYEETVKHIGRDDILAYFREHYRPENMAVVITGDFDKEGAAKTISGFAQGYGTAKAGHAPLRGIEKPKTERRQVIERDIRESYVALSFPAPSITHEDTVVLDVLARILGDGDSSRLQDQLKFRKGIVTNISTYLFSPKEDGLFIIIATFRGHGIDDIVKAVDGEIVRLLNEGPTDEEMERAKNKIRASYIYGSETVQGAARLVGNYQTLTGNPRYPEKYLKDLEAVKASDVMRVLTNYIQDRQKNIAALIPKKTSNPHTFSLKNGMTYVVNRNTSSPSFAFRIGFVGGLRDEPQGKNGLFHVLSRMLIKGTKTKDAASIAKEIEILAGDISPYNGRNVFGLGGRFLSKDLTRAFALLRELLTETVFTEEELQKVKLDVLSSLRQRDDDPISFAFRRFTESLYEGHPYSKDSLGSEKDVATITLADVSDYYRRFVTPSGAVLAISGDVDEKVVRDLVEGFFQEWKGPTNVLGRDPISAKKRAVVEERDMMQAHLIFGFLGPGLIDEDRYAVEVMDAILSGMGGRIHKVLREENPYAYALTFFNQMAYDRGGIGIYIGTDPSFVGKVDTLARAEITAIIKNGFTDQEISDAKNYLVGNHAISMQSNSAVALNMCLDTLYGLKPDFFKKWPKRIQKVELEEVNRVARKYLALDTMVFVRVGGAISRSGVMDSP